MSVTLSEVKRAARAHRAPLAGESAGYLVLALADQVLSAPRLIQPGDVQLTEDGGLRVLRGQASSEADAELSLRRALDDLLLVASSGSAALMRAGRRAVLVGMPALVRELEAALIPVNRAAARRALARLHRETARALSSGELPDDVCTDQQPAAPSQSVLPVLSVAPVLPEPAHVAPTTVPETTAVLATEAPRFELEEEDLETRAIHVHAPEAVDLPPALSNLDGVLSALCENSALPPELSQSSGALTVALDVRPVSRATGAAELADAVALDEDVEFIDEEPSDALTVARNLDVLPIAQASASGDSCVELPEEVCTRPEPIIVRRALGASAPYELPATSVEPPVHTPTLGSLAAELPRLAPEQIAELSAANALFSAGSEECTEPMPEVQPLSPGVAIVTSRQSDVSELLQNFQVAQDDSSQGLRRAIKEMADLDLTPAPFAALIR